MMAKQEKTTYWIFQRPFLRFAVIKFQNPLGASVYQKELSIASLLASRLTSEVAFLIY